MGYHCPKVVRRYCLFSTGGIEMGNALPFPFRQSLVITLVRCFAGKCGVEKGRRNTRSPRCRGYPFFKRFFTRLRKGVLRRPKPGRDKCRHRCRWWLDNGHGSAGEIDPLGFPRPNSRCNPQIPRRSCALHNNRGARRQFRPAYPTRCNWPRSRRGSCGVLPP